MKVLLLGGTGVIGNSLVRKLNADNIDVYVTSRCRRTSYDSVHYIQGNAKDLNFLKGVCKLEKWNVIIDFMSYKTNEFAERYELLLDSTTQYIFISSARVYGNEEHPIKETSLRLLDSSTDDDFLKTDEYSLTKARQENLLFSSLKKKYTIVRPCITYGKERLQLGVLEKEEWLYRAIHGRTVVFCREILDSITTMTIGNDMCNAIYELIGKPFAVGEVFHLTSSHHRTWNEIFKIYQSAFLELMNKDLKMKVVSLDQFLECRLPYLKYQVIYDRVFNRDYNVDKEKTFIDVDSFVSPEDGLKMCLAAFLEENRPFKNINWLLEARKDKLTKEYTPLNEISGIKNKISYFFERYIR